MSTPPSEPSFDHDKMPRADQPGWPQAPSPGTPPPGYQSGPRFPGPQGYPGGPGGPWTPQDPYAKSRMAAGLLGIFVGVFGVHRFYLGYTGIGLVMLLSTVLSFGILSPVVAIWGLVEGILYLTDKTGNYSRDSTGRPLRD